MTCESCLNQPTPNRAIDPRKRHRARRALLQALYQWQLNPIEPDQIEQQFQEDEALRKADIPFFLELLRGVTENEERLDRAYEPFLDRPIDELGLVERSALLAGTYELLEDRTTPYRVVIDEWVQLAKVFGAQDSFKYVNAILDAVAKSAGDTVHG